MSALDTDTKSQKWLLWLLIAIFLFLGVAVRSYRLGILRPIEDDEISWILPGVTLITKGSPESWTAFWDRYPDDLHTYYLGSEDYTTVIPFLDHPPAFSLTMGAWTILTGNHNSTVLNWAILRLPMILISLLTLISTSFLAYRLTNKMVAILTLVNAVFLPTHILSSRFIATEHLIGLLLVVSAIILTYAHQTTKKQLVTALLVIICIISPMIKLSGLVVPLFIILYAAYKRNLNLFLPAFIGTYFSLCLLYLYFKHYDLNLFLDLLKAHSHRAQSFWHLFTLFSEPDVGYLPLKDPQYLLGVISIFVMGFHHKFKTSSKKLWQFLILSLSFILLVVAPNEFYGWYKFLIFPFIFIGLGFMWYRVLNRESGWLILILPSILILLENIFSTIDQDLVLRKPILIVAFFISSLLLVLRPPLKYYRVLVFGLLIFILQLELIWPILFLSKQAL